MKLFHCILFLLAALGANAHEGVSPTTSGETVHLEHFSMDNSELSQTHCSAYNQAKDDPLKYWSQTANQWLKQKKVSTYYEDFSFFGKNLRGTPGEVDAFKALIDEAYFKDRPEDQSNILSKLEAAKCQSVNCALSAVFGEQEAPLLEFMYRKYGYNGSTFGSTLQGRNDKDVYQPWKPEQIADLLTSASFLPDAFVPLEKNRLLLHVKNSMSYSDGNTPYANSSIQVFSKLDGEAFPVRVYALIHEFGHQWAQYSSSDEHPEWLKCSSWHKTPIKTRSGEIEEGYFSADHNKHVSQYALTNPAEDFAESFAAYRVRPEWL